jgi:Uma2 family endonuclease
MAVSPAVRFTYEDYLLLPEDRRYEIIDGELFMTPAPTPYHQIVAGNLYSLLKEHVQKRELGQVLFAPCDVLLSETDVVQPDVLFISKERASIIGEKYISAAPDLVVEVLSPATAGRDQTLKKKLYAQRGVRELWFASPEAKSVEVLINSGDSFRREAIYGTGDTLASPLLPEFEIPITSVF